MKISKRTGISLLMLAVFISLIAQYPYYKVHAGNWDHYFIFFLARSISTEGYAPWVVNWSSYFGLHWISYPQGAPFLLSSFQQFSGDYSESLVLVYSYMEGVMAVVFAFALGLKIRKKDYVLAFFIAILFSTAPSYLYVSEWTASARGLFITLLPFLLLLNLFMFDISKQRKVMMFLNVFMIVLLFSIHRMAFFMLATIIPAILFTYMIHYRGGFFSDRFSEHYSENKWKYVALTLSILMFIISIYYFYNQKVFSDRISSMFTSGNVLSGNSFVIRLANMGFTFVASAGILVAFGFISFKDVLKNKRFNITNTYLTILILSMGIIIFYPSYFRPYASIFLSVMVGMFLIMLLYSKKHLYIGKINLKKTLIPVLLAISLLFSLGMQAHWNQFGTDNPKQWMDYDQEEVVNAVEMSYSNRIFISSSDLMRTTVVYSDGFSMPPGGYTYDYYFYIFARDPELIEPSDLHLSFEPRVEWGGEIYLYKEHPRVDDSLYKIYNLSYYDTFEIKDGNASLDHFSRKTVEERNYRIYSNDEYSIYLVDPSDEVVKETQLYFVKP